MVAGVPLIQLFGRLEDGPPFLVEDDRYRPCFFVPAGAFGSQNTSACPRTKPPLPAIVPDDVSPSGKESAEIPGFSRAGDAICIR